MIKNKFLAQNGATHANGSTVSNTIQRYFKVPFSSTADFFSGNFLKNFLKFKINAF